MKQKIKELLKKKWYFQGFNGTPALLYGATFSAVYDMPKTLGYGYKAIIELFEEDKCYFLYGWEDLFSILDNLRSRVKKDKNYLKFLLDKDEEVCNKALAFYKKIGAADISKKSDEELSKLYKETDRMYGVLLSVSHIIEGFTLTCEDKIRERVQKHFKEKSSEMLKTLVAPLWPPFLSAEHNELHKIIEDIKEAGLKKIDKDVLSEHSLIHDRIKEHQKNYFWKNNSYASSKILLVEDFVNEINGILMKDIDVEKKIKEFEETKENKKRKEKILEEVNDPELSELIAINDVIFRIHDHRKECMTISLHYIDIFLKEMGKRKEIPVELMRYIRAAEFSDVASLKEELKERKKKSVYVTLPEGVFVFTGKEADEYISELNKQIKAEETDVIKGSCASKGKVTGIVKVCRGEKEISKMEKGKILVACMTQPEFVPAMKKAIAVITDEGGLTCHAAIISRELGIPCVIGTKIATKVLKDGMEVEVDADKGVVKILKK